ncbi:MAG: hypothetical protein QS748_02160 [Candidatus Endonucleobacter bathymodioli]|uniref:Uncharacterized protein n=1 Tax=Candidatus Endonucleibacter bathymodioli TaxID=539814 RepID=A0AA90SCG0_9GAMM|nr:hypothetical protein [Candidatus Endonucleobacter bathymodioli]
MRELYEDGILPDKAQISAAEFLRWVLDGCHYMIECNFSDNDAKYKGTPDHEFVDLSKSLSIG